MAESLTNSSQIAKLKPLFLKEASLTASVIYSVGALNLRQFVKIYFIKMDSTKLDDINTIVTQIQDCL